MSVGFLYCLKRERDISVKPILGGVKTALRCIPALKGGVHISAHVHESKCFFSFLSTLWP